MNKVVRFVFSFLFSIMSTQSNAKTTNVIPPISLKYQPEKVEKSDFRENKDTHEAEYKDAIRKTANMVNDVRSRELVSKYGLDILNVTWEDTGRYKGSSVGPNISDMTIQVNYKNGQTKTSELSLMPVIRYNNFSDKTADVDPMAFTLLVGNEEGQELRKISLREFLEDPTQYLSHPKEWKSSKKTLLASRDSKVLVSAQAAFLPVPLNGKAEFNPVLFNYQSYAENPAVLTILATNEGTSVTIIDNKADTTVSGSWGQRLFHNDNGQRASLTGQRMTDHLEKNSDLKNEDLVQNIKRASALNMVMLIQIPLKQKIVHRKTSITENAMVQYFGSSGGSLAAKADSSSDEKSNVEAAVIGHGDFDGPFHEINNLSIERDPQFPIRVTVQFYKATSNGVVSEEDIKQVKSEIDSVLNNGAVIGSLVTEGNTGRMTEYEGLKVQPINWWDDFWLRHYQNTGETRQLAINKLKTLIGKDYMEKKVSELMVCDLLQKKFK